MRGNGMLGEEAGESPRELSVHWTLGTPKWGTVMGWRPPQGDAVGRKNRTEGWRTGMVWELGGYCGRNPVWPHLNKLDNIIIKEAKGEAVR